MVLEALQAGPLTVRVLGDRMGWPYQTTGAVLKTLLRRGLVKREGRQWRIVGGVSAPDNVQLQ